MSGWMLAVETGGTKIVARLVGPDATHGGQWATSTPEMALADLANFVQTRLPAGTRLQAIGLASFGPLVLRGVDAGRLLATPKPHWAGANLAAGLTARFGCPVAVETDVGAAALAERAAAPDLPSLAYLTVGTGIGAGLATDAGTLQGALHPEVGHIRLVRGAGDCAPSVCPFHDDCAEGLASGPAVTRRLAAGEDLSDRSDVRLLTAGYLAQLLVTLVLAWSPHRIVLGGGLGTASGMLPAVRERFAAQIGRYGADTVATAAGYISPPTLQDSGLEGAVLLARGVARPSAPASPSARS